MTNTISDIDQETLDIDWFFTNNIEIAFVASGGGKLPLSVAESKSDLDLLVSYFHDLPYRCEALIDPGLGKVISKINDMYLDSYVYMSGKGLFSYDKTTYGNWADKNYHLVARPANPLKLDELPLEILTILRKTVLVGNMPVLINLIDIKWLDLPATH